MALDNVFECTDTDDRTDNRVSSTAVMRYLVQLVRYAF